jgi:hypothetical protein
MLAILAVHIFKCTISTQIFDTIINIIIRYKTKTYCDGTELILIKLLNVYIVITLTCYSLIHTFIFMHSFYTYSTFVIPSM